MNNFTLIFCFYCNNINRRKYLNYCIQSIQRYNKQNDFDVLVVDGSDPDNHELNKKLFSAFQHLTIIHDEEKNPIRRLYSNINVVKTKYCFKILEDCLFVDYDLSKTIRMDIKLLESKSENTVVQYPTLSNENMYIINDVLVYQNIKKSKNVFIDGATRYYSRLLDRKHHNYLCNNVIYNTEFLKRHLLHYSTISLGHAAAESDRFDKFFGVKYNSETTISKVVKWCHKHLFRSKLISETLITENFEKGVVLHIGYESTELDYFDNLDRVVVGKEKDVVESSVLASLEKLSNLLKADCLIISEMGTDEEICFNNNIY